MAQQLALVVIGLAGTFLAIGVSIVATIRKPRMRYAYIFFGLAIMMLFFFWLGWYVAPSATSQDDTIRQTTQRSDTTWPYWLAGIGTLALALATVYVEIIKPRWNRPRFSVEFENAEPYCRVARQKVEKPTGPSQEVCAYFLRIKVANVGKSVANRCVGKLVEVEDDSGNVLSGYDPWALHWVGTDWDKIPFSSIDLNQSEYEYLDVLYTREDLPNLAIICKDKSLRGLEPWFRPGTYVLQITIYGDNVKPESKRYCLAWGATDYKDIKLEAL